MTDQIEVERKWRLLNGMPQWVWAPIVPYFELDQAYTQIEPIEQRVRSDGEGYMLTFKPEGTIARSEWEKQIPEWVYLGLRAKTSWTVEKRRYPIWFSSLKWELDEYLGRHDGLVVVETELTASTEGLTSDEIRALTQSLIIRARAITLPAAFGPAVDVTDDKRYKNKNLAVHGLPKPEEDA